MISIIAVLAGSWSRLPLPIGMKKPASGAGWPVASARFIKASSGCIRRTITIRSPSVQSGPSIPVLRVDRSAGRQSAAIDRFRSMKDHTATCQHHFGRDGVPDSVPGFKGNGRPVEKLDREQKKRLLIAA